MIPIMTNVIANNQTVASLFCERFDGSQSSAPAKNKQIAKTTFPNVFKAPPWPSFLGAR
jgi:hypothetical protein